MSKEKDRRFVVVADGTKYFLIKTPWATTLLSDKPALQVIVAKSSRLPGIRRAMLSDPHMHADVEGSYSFFQGRAAFDASEAPCRGDHLLIRRITDGRVLEVTPPVIQVGVCG